MTRVSLTDRFVASCKASGLQVDYFDEKSPGLALRVSPGGVKAWTLHFTLPSGKKRARMTLGRYPDSSLSEARTRALEARGHLEDGKDPREVFKAQRSSALVVADLIESYLEKHARPNLRTAKAIERRLSKNVLPAIGKVGLGDLHRREITRVIDPILKREKPVEAARVFEDMRAMFRWAVARGDLDHSPMDGMKKPPMGKPRERVLSDDELRMLWRRLPEALPRSKECEQIIRLCLLTGQRVGEVAGMTRDELDMKARAWTIPASRSKNKHAHTVPLSEAALAVIREAAGETYLFPGKGNGPLPAHAVAHTIRLAQDRFRILKWTAHDLRRTVVTQMAQLGIAPVVIANVVNHRSVSKAGVTFAVYAQYDYRREKRQALELWADRLAAIVGGGGDVLPMRARS